MRVAAGGGRISCLLTVGGHAAGKHARIDQPVHAVPPARAAADADPVGLVPAEGFSDSTFEADRVRAVGRGDIALADGAFLAVTERSRFEPIRFELVLDGLGLR